MNQSDRDKIKIACRFYGGIKPLAAALGVNQGNLSRWLNGKPTLSNAKIANLLKLIGLPYGSPDTSEVHVWSIRRVAFLNLTPGLSLYFPDGAEICRAPWVVPDPSIKETFGIGDGLDNLYAITDGKARAILRIPRALLLQKENYKNLLHWKCSDQNVSVLNIPEITEEWINGKPSKEEFDRAWSQPLPSLTEADVIKAIREKGISFGDAIEAIQAINKPRMKS